METSDWTVWTASAALDGFHLITTAAAGIIGVPDSARPTDSSQRLVFVSPALLRVEDEE